MGEAWSGTGRVPGGGGGGGGKTRLALRVAADLRRSFDDGVWLVELSALRNAELLARTVAAGLGLPDEASGDPLDLLAEYLAGRHLLLILDTCEHPGDACAKLAEALFRAGSPPDFNCGGGRGSRVVPGGRTGAVGAAVGLPGQFRPGGGRARVRRRPPPRRHPFRYSRQARREIDRAVGAGRAPLPHARHDPGVRRRAAGRTR